VGDYRLLATGRAAHAGVEPEKGISAITELAHQVLAVQALAAPALGTTVTVGMIGGGSAPNVVPAAAWAEVDVRFSSAAEAARLDSAIRSLAPVVAGATLEVTGGVNRPPMERTDATAALYQAARAAASSLDFELGFELGEGSTGGGSDGNFTAALGVPTLDGLGPDGGGAHALHEHVLLADLPRRVALLRALLLAL
jgi:glutamate carboxypeptidase